MCSNDSVLSINANRHRLFILFFSFFFYWNNTVESTVFQFSTKWRTDHMQSPLTWAKVHIIPWSYKGQVSSSFFCNPQYSRRLAVHKQIFLNLLRQNGRRVTKVYLKSWKDFLRFKGHDLKRSQCKSKYHLLWIQCAVSKLLVFAIISD